MDAVAARRDQRGVALSHAKHNAARWLESVGGSNGFYKSLRHLDFAMNRSEAMTANYVDTHRRYFRYHFAQTIAFLLIYAFASAGLLLLGGMLILRGQLSLGQLVAAELILSGVFYGISQFGWYLDTFYDLVASSEELSLLFAIPQEPTVRGDNGPRDGSVKLTDVAFNDARYNLTLAAGEQLVTVTEPGAERLLAMLLKRHSLPDRGLVRIGNADLGSFDMYRLRSDVTVLDRSTIVEVTIREYLRLASGELAEKAMEALALVGLERRLASLPQGLDTPLGSTGYPLSVGETMALKLANALLVGPKLLLLGQLYDLLPPERCAPRCGCCGRMARPCCCAPAARRHGTRRLSLSRSDRAAPLRAACRPPERLSPGGRRCRLISSRISAPSRRCARHASRSPSPGS